MLMNMILAWLLHKNVKMVKSPPYTSIDRCMWDRTVYVAGEFQASTAVIVTFLFLGLSDGGYSTSPLRALDSWSIQTPASPALPRSVHAK